MPFITYTTVQGALTDEQKTDLSRALTDAVVNTLGEGLKPNIWVELREAPEGNFHIGGHKLKAANLKKLMSPPGQA